MALRLNENEGVYAYSNFLCLAAILEEEASFADGGTFFVLHRKCVYEHKYFPPPFHCSPPSIPPPRSSEVAGVLGSVATDPKASPHSQDNGGPSGAGKGN